MKTLFHQGVSRMAINPNLSEDKIYDIKVSYHPVNYPMTWSYPNDYKYPIFYDEKKLGGSYVYVHILSGELICSDEGDRDTPPLYEPDWNEIIIVQPKLKYWGKGLK